MSPFWLFHIYIADQGHWTVLFKHCYFVNIVQGYMMLCFSSSDAESMVDVTSQEVFNAAKETLLQGLSEENQGLQ